MAITVYAQRADFFARHPPTMLGARSLADVDYALATSSSDMDDSFRGRFPLPFATVGGSVVRRCVDHAWYLFMGGRGFDPQSDADRLIVADEAEYQVWIDKVQRGVLFPSFTADPTAQILLPPTVAEYGQPTANSSSSVNSDGGRAATRGW